MNEPWRFQTRKFADLKSINQPLISPVRKTPGRRIVVDYNIVQRNQQRYLQRYLQGYTSYIPEDTPGYVVVGPRCPTLLTTPVTTLLQRYTHRFDHSPAYNASLSTTLGLLQRYTHCCRPHCPALLQRYTHRCRPHCPALLQHYSIAVDHIVGSTTTLNTSLLTTLSSSITTLPYSPRREEEEKLAKNQSIWTYQRRF